MIVGNSFNGATVALKTLPTEVRISRVLSEYCTCGDFGITCCLHVDCRILIIFCLCVLKQ